MYVFSSCAILISIYTLYTIYELKVFVENSKSKSNNAWDNYSTKSAQGQKKKGHWS